MDTSATGKAVDAVEAILTIAQQNNFSDIERLCTDALSVYHDQDMDLQLRNEADNALLRDMQAANLNSLEMNHCIRFGIPVDQMEKGRKKIKDFIKLGTLSSRDYENIVDFDILRMPIVDICVTQKNDPVPDGFYRISLTPSQKSANIKTGTSGKTMYICIKKASSETPISSLVIILPDRNEHVPPGFSVVKRDGRVCNLNTGTGGERMFLCFKRDKLCNPITDIQIFFPGKGEMKPKSFNLLDRSVRSVGLDLNMGTGALKITLSYHQSLVNLECLRISHRKDGALIKGRAASVVDPNGTLGPEAVKALSLADELVHHEESPSTIPSQVSTDSVGAIQDASSGSATKLSEHHRAVSGELDSIGGVDDDNVSAPSVTSDGDHVSDCIDDVHNLLMDGSAASEPIVTVDDKLAPLSIRRCLHPILACLYVRQGNLFNIAVDSLELFLTKTDLFTHDFKPRLSSNSKTTIDLVIECLCERLDIYHENTNDQVLKLLQMIIERSHGAITRHSVKKIFRATTFVSSCYAAEKHWVSNGYSGPMGLKGDHVLSFDVLKGLIQAVCEAAETSPICMQLPTITEVNGASNMPLVRSKSPVVASGLRAYHDHVAGILSGDVSEAAFMAHEIVVNLVVDIVDTIELSRISETALQAVSKRSFTTASPKFWMVVETCSRSLFAQLPLRNAYVLLAGLCKVASLGLGGYQTGTENGDKALQYLGNKLFALDAIKGFCKRCRYKMKMSKLMGYQIRRLVVPCILANMEYALVEPRIFVRLMKLMSVLWHNWREHVRVEFSVLCEQLVLKVLNASPQRLSPIYAMIALTEIFNWFEQPHLSLEMFVNYDMHSKYVADWNIFSHVSRAVCTLAKNCSKSSASVADVNSKRNIVNSPGPQATSQLDVGPLASTQAFVVGDTSNLFNKSSPPVTFHDVKMMALEVSVRITRSIMDASGHANMVQQDTSKLKSSVNVQKGGPVKELSDPPAASGWVERELESFDEGETQARSKKDEHIGDNFSVSMNVADNPSDASEGSSMADSKSVPVASPINKRNRSTSIRFTRNINAQSNDLLTQAAEICREKQSMAKAVKFLVSKNFMSNTPQEYASFVRLYKKRFDPAAIGDFLGEGGRTKEEEQFWDQTRFRFTRAISFVEMELEAALRLYFTGCGFRLPGEAQKIDRFVTAFVRVYWEDNMSTSYCPYRQQDTVHLLSYAIIMLNTDLHRASSAGDRRGSTKIKQMTKEQFIHNLRGVDVDSLTGEKYDISTAELCKIYDSILARPIEMAVQSASKPPVVPNGGASAVTTRETFDDSLPISPEDQKRFIIELMKSLRAAGELLRDQSNVKQRFLVIGVDASISLELVQFMFEAVWHDFHEVTDGLLTKICSEENVLFSALEILANALSVCIFLDMKVERISFVTQLINFKTAVEKIESRWAAQSISPVKEKVSSDRVVSKSFKEIDEKWFDIINNVTPETVMIAIKELHTVIVNLKDTIQICARHEATKTIMSKIEKKANIYDPNRFIIKDGDLNKRCRNAKMVNYHFFLFSDLLIYAHFGFSEYKVHVQMPLEDMNVALVDPADDPEDRSFFIEHPVKSFAVEASCTAEKRLWMRELSVAIEACIKRRSRSLSLFDRFQEQEEKVTERQKLHHDMIGSPATTNTGGAYNILKRFSLSTLASVVGGTSNQTLVLDNQASSNVKDDPSSFERSPAVGLSSTDEKIKTTASDNIDAEDINLDINAV